MIIYWGVADSLAGEGDRVPLMDCLWRTRHLMQRRNITLLENHQNNLQKNVT